MYEILAKDVENYGMVYYKWIWYTPPETNIAPKNRWLEDYFPVGMASWQGLC